MIITRSPLRISFFGGGTDYPEYFCAHGGGAVLATAIDRFCFLTANRFESQLFDYDIRISYRKVELVKKLDDIEHAVYRECLRHCGLDRDIELHAMADLPSFTGLGSSSSFTVALLHALYSYQGRFLTPHQLACEAIHVERHLLHDTVGCQDQVLAAFGGFNLVEFFAEDNIVVHRVPISSDRLSQLQANLFLVFTGIRRRAADVAASQINRMAGNKDALRGMRSMVEKGWDILTGGRSLSAFGELLHEAWVAKRSLDPCISNTQIDEFYERGLKTGALGGKLLGAGGGGFLLFFAPPERHEALRQAFSGQTVIEVQLGAPGSEVIFASK
jgi:D-glycero-alpha-D-manno-heptose-7-phosphate kinase